MTIHVVFVDDEPDICELYADFFESETVRVTTFTDPVEALAFLQKTPVDTCIIDYRMPHMDGLQLRAELPDKLPCYLISGELELECPPGFVGCFQKPVRLEDLESIIDSLNRIQ